MTLTKSFYSTPTEMESKSIYDFYIGGRTGIRELNLSTNFGREEFTTLFKFQYLFDL